MTALIIGANGGIGRAISLNLAKMKTNLILVASDKKDLASLSNHISNVFNVKVEIHCVNFLDKNSIKNLLDF